MFSKKFAAYLAAAALLGCPIATAQPSGAQQSRLFPGVFVPAGAELGPSEDTAPGAERWDIRLAYRDTVTQETALLPIGKRLSGLPWCRTQVDSDGVMWIWGKGPNALIVGANEVSSNVSVIVIRGGENVPGGSAYAYDCPG